ncbi:HIT family protein [Polyangium sp. 6x1]|uniref:HIT family protein n=1 Tax=Polyangium sp. 6x1 TaxID=3042689 RepID=UPI0024831620|nr:HIT family protein [Polyangium sp. 6x1]MDI1442548.1 HIT family protein [Polyangium sp. 6x1]
MPRLVSRVEALDRIRNETGEVACLMCAIRDRRAGPVFVVHEDDHQLVLLPRYVRRWGQLMVMPKRHAVSFGEIDDETWAETNRLVLHAARVVERVMRPRRCYLASTGSAAGEITQSSTHLHVHVIPLLEPDDKPADIFSWSAGVYIADSEEWESLRARYGEAW